MATSTVWGLREKKTLYPQERDEQARQQWQEHVKGRNPKKLVFLDETGGWLGIRRPYGRILGGQRLTEQAPKRKHGKVSLIAAIGYQGLSNQRCLLHDESVDTNAFLSYLHQVLLPPLEPGSIVVMDNYTIHHNAEVRDLIEGANCELLYLPTYSPDFNPIEHIFAKIKAFLKRVCPQTVDDLMTAFADAIASVSPEDVQHAFNHCGYSSQ
jgi:transposase